MRKLLISALALTAAALAVPSAVQAAPPKCDGKMVTVDCLRDEVLILDGAQLVETRPLVSCTMGADGKPVFGDCHVNYKDAVTRAIQVVGADVPVTQWDEFVIFGQQIAPAKDAPGPVFFREGYKPAAAGVPGPMGMPGADTPAVLGVNEVEGIGLPTVPRTPGRPLVGYIAAGSSAQPFSKNAQQDPVTGSYGPCGKAQKNATDPLAASTAPALCYGGFYNFFDALAQASGGIYGPYLNSPMGTPPLSVVPLGKTGIATTVDTQTMTKITKWNDATLTNAFGVGGTELNPRIWNSLLNLKGSLFAGNNYRDNGNGTFETSKPTAYYGINLPFPAGWKAGTSLNGTQIMRFQALDLYVMGLLPADNVELKNIQTFAGLTPDQIYRPTSTTFTDQGGPQMGFKTGVAVRPPGKIGEVPVLNFDSVVAANMPRKPAFADAPHFIKQLWVVVTKPQPLLDPAAKDPAGDQTKNFNWVNIWRHFFPSYYYMLTGYRGRVVTTFDGVDDNAYWEFGQRDDDLKLFTALPGVTIDVPAQGPNSPSTTTALRFTAAPANTGVKYSGQPLGVRIPGDKSLTAPYNAVTVRMRIRTSKPENFKGAFATLAFENGPSIRLPASCGNPARANCTESSSLIADGKWKNYAATLDHPDFLKGTFNGFTFAPSSVALQANEVIEVDFIRIGNVASAKDSDTASCWPCAKCNVLDQKDAQDACNRSCEGKGAGEMATGLNVPDGWIDSEDNCPTVYNPLQEDGNGDGVGDACEDFDGDGVVNACDNCPTATNSRQRDVDGDGAGDVCDSEKPAACFLKPETLAGHAPMAPSALFTVVMAGAIGLLAFRRRRKSR